MADDPSSRVVFGVRPVEELCRARPREVAVVYLAEGHRSREIEVAVAAAKDRGLTVEIRPRALVAGLAGAPAHQGIVAIVGEYRYALIADMLLRLRRRPRRRCFCCSIASPTRRISARWCAVRRCWARTGWSFLTSTQRR